MNTTSSRHSERAPFAAVVLGMLLSASAGLAAAATPLSLTDQPIYVAGGVPPNVLISFDDSDSLISTMTNEAYLRCNLLATSWVGWNGLAYDPSIAYEVPPRSDGSPRPQPSFTNAPSDGFNPDDPQFLTLAGRSHIDLSSEYFAFIIAFPCQNEAPQRAYYATGDALDALTKVPISVAEQQNFANWYSFYRNRILALKSTTALSFMRAKTGGFRLAWQGFNATRAGVEFSDRTGPSEIGETRLFDYPTRKRLMDWLFHTVNLRGNTPTVSTTLRAGEYFSQRVGRGANVVLPGESGLEAQCRANYNLVVTDGIWNDQAYAATVADFDGTATTLPTSHLDDAPAIASYDPAASSSSVYRGAFDRSLADVAFRYWSRDLLPNVDNRVPPSMVDISDSPTDPVWNPANDPASWQHMVNHIITFAVGGSTSPSPDSADDLMSLRTGTLTWPSPAIITVPYDRPYVLDTWHAALNSRGSLLMATRPSEVADRLSALLDSFVQSSARTAPVSLATGQVGGDGVAYQVSMKSTGWSGDLVAYGTNADGSLADPRWSAACTLTGGSCETVPLQTGGAPTPAPGARTLITASADRNSGVAFRWQSLSASQREWLSTSPVTDESDDLGPKRVDWVRGERGAETTQGGPLRSRESVLGAIVDSQPVVVSRPVAAYPDVWPGSAPENDAGTAYSTFVANHQSRRTMLYVAADDGMLHAFDDTGIERFAYVPDAAIAKLPALADENFTRGALLRGTPMVRDAFVGGRWRTVLVSALGLGGRGLFALDVTTPDAVTESETNVLWDRTGADDRLGYIYGSPYIARLADGKWWAISGNGYNSPHGRAALVMVRLEDGEMRFIEVGAVADPLGQDRANGLSAPVVSDFDRDGIAEAVFAGDVFGNLWKFDLDSKTPSEWQVAGVGNSSEPLFTARGPSGEYQPITFAPRLLRGRTSNRLVLLFGTGKTIEHDDMRPGKTPTQSIYALFDVAGDERITRADLVERNLQTGDDVGGFRTRTLTGDAIGDAKGWVFDLDADERVTSSAVPRGNVAFVPTLLPLSRDPCKSQFSSWLMLIDPESGLAPRALDEAGNARATPVLDLDGDGSTGSGDLGSNTGGVAGVAFDDPIVGLTIGASAPQPGRVTPLCDTAIVGGASGATALASTCFAPQRIGWRQLLPE